MKPTPEVVARESHARLRRAVVELNAAKDLRRIALSEWATSVTSIKVGQDVYRKYKGTGIETCRVVSIEGKVDDQDALSVRLRVLNVRRDGSTGKIASELTPAPWEPWETDYFKAHLTSDCKDPDA